jgi:hypothetical protein
MTSTGYWPMVQAADILRRMSLQSGQTLRRLLVNRPAHPTLSILGVTIGWTFAKGMLFAKPGEAGVTWVILPFVMLGFAMFLLAAKKPVNFGAESIRFVLWVSFAVWLFWFGNRLFCFWPGISGCAAG